jgi:2-keto-4-pentenoate hydratase/2-oxohepta-3-ene-1,7-dioic acid hydratase in catechol pathway
MRFARTRTPDGPVTAVVDGDRLHPLPAGTDLRVLIGEGLDALLVAGTAALDAVDPIEIAERDLLAPVDPPTIRDFTTFERHVEGMVMGMGGAFPESFYVQPAFYFSNPHAVTGPFDDIPLPPGTGLLDFELEVAAVIGPAGRNLSVAAARDHIIGYTLFNDWSARDIQSVEMRAQLGPAKGKDTANTLGPWLVTADELEPTRDGDGFLDIAVSVEVNGRRIGEDTLASGSWTFDQLVALASRGTWVRPGDVIGAGTVGSGCLAELWGRHGIEGYPPIAVGDTVTMCGAGIGTIRNQVVAGDEVHDIGRGTHRFRRAGADHG